MSESESVSQSVSVAELMSRPPTLGFRQATVDNDGDVDVVVVGEINEWETSEYARDAVRQKKNKALIILGHANSEEPGMKYLAEWLRPMLPAIGITFVPAGDPFRLMGDPV